MTQANLIEIYSSIQGEGPYLGQPMVFVRFQDCALSCRFCDTPSSFVKHAEFRSERAAYSRNFFNRKNPVSSKELTQLLQNFSDPHLSLTGGEPLQQSSFLRDWLPQLQGQFQILLETNGVLPQALVRVIDYVDIIAMDIKLPSVTGMKSYWEEHIEFLKIARQKELYVKVVVSAPLEVSELQDAIAMVEKYAPQIPFILQPVSQVGAFQESIEESRLRELYDISIQRLHDVRVIPQVHSMLELL